MKRQTTVPRLAIGATLLVLATLVAACTQAPRGGDLPLSMANPASLHCQALGGQTRIETRADGGQFGVCLFEDNRQCEEWALFHGRCPPGGIRVTGYLTEAARYCAITGGSYQVTTPESETAPESGRCRFESGGECEASAYWKGDCDPRPVSETQQ